MKLRLGLLLLVLRTCAAQNGASFGTPPTNLTTQNRIGWKYLGYYLSALGASFGGSRGFSIQTLPSASTQVPNLPTFPSFTTTAPVTSSVRPSPFPTAPPLGVTFPTLITSGPGAGLTFPTLRPTAPAVASTFPTAPPSSLPTGIVTSVAQTSFPNGVGVHTPGDFADCECTLAGTCRNTQNRDGGVDIRIVTEDEDEECPAGFELCCVILAQFSCGLQNYIGGTNAQSHQAEFGEFPWSVIIYRAADEAYVGGGALIDSRHILTAAHKVEAYRNNPGSLKLRFGDWDRTAIVEPYRHVEKLVARIMIHPNYEASTLRHDMAVIRFNDPVTTLVSPYPQINTVCLPASTDVFNRRRCLVAGWGNDHFNGQLQSIIKYVDVQVVPPLVCENALKATRLGPTYQLDAVSFICAGGEASKDACTGDGGYALVCQTGDDGQYTVAGITAGGIECGKENVPGLYVNVASYRNWINAQVVVNSGIDPRRQPVG